MTRWHDGLPLHEVVRRVALWQSQDYLHPLTCGNDSGHRKLYATVAEYDGPAAVVLRCLDCDYEQRHIPHLPAQPLPDPFAALAAEMTGVVAGACTVGGRFYISVMMDRDPARLKFGQRVTVATRPEAP